MNATKIETDPRLAETRLLRRPRFTHRAPLSREQLCTLTGAEIASYFGLGHLVGDVDSEDTNAALDELVNAARTEKRAA